MAAWSIGVDLGQKAAHVAVVLDENGQQAGKRWRFGTSAAEMDRLVTEILGMAPQGTPLRFLMEPTPTWQVVGGYLRGHDHQVYLVTPAQVHDMRKLLRRHQKTDQLDALALAKLPFISPDRVHPAPFPPDGCWQALKRGVKREHKLAGRIGETKQVLEGLAEFIMPGLGALFSNPARPLDRLLYQQYARPETVVRIGPMRLHQRLEQALKRSVDRGLIERLHQLAQEALQLHTVTGADTNDMQTHIRYELKILDLLVQQQQTIKKRNFSLYRQLDPQQLVMSLPGIGEVLAPAFLLCKPVIDQLLNPRKLRAYAGWVPSVSASGYGESKRARMTKSGPAWLKRALYIAADAARRVDPQLAAVYHRAMAQKGKTHNQAVVEVGAHLLDRLFCVIKENRPYEFRDLTGKPIGKTEAGGHAAGLAVPQEVRRRLRRRKSSTTEHRREALNPKDPACKALPACPPPQAKHRTHPSAQPNPTS